MIKRYQRSQRTASIKKSKKEILITITIQIQLTTQMSYHNSLTSKALKQRRKVREKKILPKKEIELLYFNKNRSSNSFRTSTISKGYQISKIYAVSAVVIIYPMMKMLLLSLIKTTQMLKKNQINKDAQFLYQQHRILKRNSIYHSFLIISN